MSNFQVGPEELDKVNEIQSKVKSHNTMDKIGAIIATSELAFMLVKKNEVSVPVTSPIFEDACFKIAATIYEQERTRAGVSGSLKKKVIKRGVQ